MAEESSSGCAVCVKIVLTFLNILYLFVGVGFVGSGIYFLIKENEFSVVIGTNVFAVSISLLVVGVVLLIVAILGLVGAWVNAWALMMMYTIMIALLICAQVVGGSTAFLYRENIETQIDKQLLAYIQNYTANPVTDYNEDSNAIIDLIQDKFHCCGLTGSADWLLYNPTYTISNGIPDSCRCYDSSDSQCRSLPIVDYGAWRQGCNQTFYDFVNKNLLAIGGTLMGFALVQLTTAFLSVGLCLCMLVDKMSQRRDSSRYTHLQSPIENTCNPVTVYYPEKTAYTTEYTEVV